MKRGRDDVQKEAREPTHRRQGKVSNYTYRPEESWPRRKAIVFTKVSIETPGEQ